MSEKTDHINYQQSPSGEKSGSYRRLDYLDQLESESIHIFREVAGQFERPALLFSGGKDSIVLVHLALKLSPGVSFPLVHIDTGHNLGGPRFQG